MSTRELDKIAPIIPSEYLAELEMIEEVEASIKLAMESK